MRMDDASPTGICKSKLFLIRTLMCEIAGEIDCQLCKSIQFSVFEGLRLRHRTLIRGTRKTLPLDPLGASFPDFHHPSTDNSASASLSRYSCCCIMYIDESGSSTRELHQERSLLSCSQLRQWCRSGLRQLAGGLPDVGTGRTHCQSVLCS